MGETWNILENRADKWVLRRDSSPSGGPLAAWDVPRELDGKMLGNENKKVSEEEAGERSDCISVEGGELGIWQLWETGWGSQAM